MSAIAERPEERDPLWTLERLLSSPNIASKTWVYRQYDTTVRTNTVVGPGGDAAVVRVRGTDRALALKTDCNGRYVYLDPRVGARIAVCRGGAKRGVRRRPAEGDHEQSRTSAIRAAPRSTSSCAKPSGHGARRATALGTPVTGGNVSLYNENPGGAVFPTPVIGMVGLVESLAHVTRAPFREEGDAIVLLGEPHGYIGASEYLSRIHGVVAGVAAARVTSTTSVSSSTRCSRRSAGGGSAHDCSDGGLAVAIVECCIMDRADQRARRSTSAGGVCRTAPCSSARRRRGAVVSTSSPDVVLAHRRGPRHSGPRHRHSGFEASGADFDEVDAHRRAARAARRRLSRNHSPDHGPVRARRAVATAADPTSCSQPGPEFMCGIFGVHGHPDATHIAQLGLYSLQHRGQESVGVVVDRRRRAGPRRAPMGTLSDALSHRTREDPGHIGRRPYALQHRGLLDDRQRAARRRALQGRVHHPRAQRQPDQRGRGAPRARGQGSIFASTNDSEVIVHELARSTASDARVRLADALERVTARTA